MKNNNILLKEEKDGILTLTLNRPEVMNSLNFDLLRALKKEVARARKTRRIRVVIITGQGNKAFCAGADLKERAGLAGKQVKLYIKTIRNLFMEIENLNKPVIAAINGIALGGGTELALASDIRIAATTALLGLTETRLAIIPGAGGTQRLPRLIGPGKAKELIFTGCRIDASEALRIGLVNQICQSEDLLGECGKMADMICEAGPLAIEQAKLTINKGLETDIREGLEIESRAYWDLIPTKDRLEGLAAFREKRKPIYTGK